MNEEFIKRLSKISLEEQDILNGDKTIKKSFYTSKDSFNIEGKKLLSSSNINIKVHTRFIDFPLHSHDYLEMMYVVKGKITHIINHEEIHLEEGDLLVMNKYLEHSIKKADINDIGVNFIITDEFLINVIEKMDKDLLLYKFIENNLKTNGKSEYLLFRLKNKLSILNILDNIIYLIEEKDDEYKLVQETTRLLFSYLNIFDDILISDSRKETKEDSEKKIILNYIKKNIRFATLYELSKQLKYSIEYTSRKVKKLFDKNFKELLTDERILLASNLLKTTNLTVIEIINKVGYENKSYFHREFKKRYGETPHKWRNH